MKNDLSVENRRVGKQKKPNMKDGIVLDGFPSTGLVNAIASECLIETPGTELFAVVDSPEFPSLSLISNAMPQFPARLHINEALKVAFFISEFNIESPIQHAVGKTILNWAVENECKMVISAAGISGQKQNASKNIKDVSVIPGEQQVYAATSSNSAAKIAKENGFVLLKSGWVGGIPAILLNEGFIAGMDVIVLLVNTLKDVPDFRASALISGAVTKLVPDLYCDIGSLMSEAQIIENKMKQIRNGRNGSMSIYK